MHFKNIAFTIDEAFRATSKGYHSTKNAFSTATKLFGIKNITASFLILVMLSQWSGAAWIHAKAHVAQWLIATAWENSLNLKQPIKPWRWADTWPVARLQWLPKDSNRAAKDLYVLQGVHGEALAFGPGLMDYAKQVGQGTAVLAGHRDTHFRFLQDVQPQDRLRIQSADGIWREYSVETTEVRHIHQDPLKADSQDQLVLITCYPFEALNPGGPLRYLVSARPSKMSEEASWPPTKLAHHKGPRLVF